MSAEETKNKPCDPSKSKSWQKMKVQRRAAEQRKMNHAQTYFEKLIINANQTAHIISHDVGCRSFIV